MSEQPKPTKKTWSFKRTVLTQLSIFVVSAALTLLILWGVEAGMHAVHAHSTGWIVVGHGSWWALLGLSIGLIIANLLSIIAIAMGTVTLVQVILVTIGTLAKRHKTRR